MMQQLQEKVYLGLGSNIGDRIFNLRDAVSRILRGHNILLKSSPIIETAAVGRVDQPDFLNMAILITTDLSPSDLMKELLKIESEMGRVRGIKWGPRIIDIDILYYGNKVIHEEELQIPHPEIGRRRFVLMNLLGMDRQMKDPVTGIPIEKMLYECTDHSAIRGSNPQLT